MKLKLWRRDVWLCLIGMVTVTCGLGLPADAASIDGRWHYVYSCEGATGVYADRCAAGDRDEFMLWLGSSGDRQCGYFATSAQLGNHADEGVVSIRTDNGRVIVIFNIWGSTGEATIKINKDRLFWHVIKRTVGDSWPVPEHLVLTRDKTRPPWACKN